MKHILLCIAGRRIMCRLSHKQSTYSRSLFRKLFPALIAHLLLKAPLLSLLPELVQGSLSSGKTYLFRAQPVAPAHPIHCWIRPTHSIIPAVGVRHRGHDKSVLSIVHARIASRSASVHGPVPVPRASVPVAAPALTIHPGRPTPWSPRHGSDHRLLLLVLHSCISRWLPAVPVVVVRVLVARSSLGVMPRTGILFLKCGCLTVYVHPLSHVSGRCCHPRARVRIIHRVHGRTIRSTHAIVSQHPRRWDWNRHRHSRCYHCLLRALPCTAVPIRSAAVLPSSCFRALGMQRRGRRSLRAPFRRPTTLHSHPQTKRSSGRAARHAVHSVSTRHRIPAHRK